MHKNNIFDTLNWITKSNKKKPEYSYESYFILNRWISMANSEYCKIVNVTANRWIKTVRDFSFIDFYHAILPKHTKKIEYLKKNTKVIKNADYKSLSENMECSIKDIVFLEKALEEINTLSK
jgi:hypothetical protein